MNNDLIKKTESFKLLLVNRATGGQVDLMEYKELRKKLLSIPRLTNYLPSFVSTCRDPDEFWSYVKLKFSGTGSYEQRREYIRKEFDWLHSFLEMESHTPSDACITATVQSVSSVFIEETWYKALERRITDPAGVIKAARTL